MTNNLTIAPTIIDLFENFLGEDLSSHSLHALNKLSPQQFKDLLDHLWKFDTDSWRELQFCDNQFVFLDQKVLDFFELKEKGVVHYINRIKHMFLYYPRVHVMHDLDPMAIMLSLTPRSYIAAFLELYIILKPIVQSHILTISTYPSASVTNPHIDELNIWDSTNYQLIQTAERIISEQKGRDKWLKNPLHMLDGFNITQVLSSTLGSQWSAGSEGDLMLHKEKLKQAKLALSSIQEVEFTAMDTLTRLQLPKIGNISFEDLIQIRNQEETFEVWRNRLTMIITSIPKDAQFNDKVVREIQDRMRLSLGEPIARLRERSTSSTIRKRIQDATIGFGLGATSLVVQQGFGLVTNLQESLSRLGISMGTALFLAQIFRKTNSNNQVLNKFYSLFDDDTTP